MNSAQTGRAVGLAPIAQKDARLLILGSLPSVESIRRQQYYGHPRNQFWPLLFEIFGKAPSEDYAQRVALLHAQKIALWDVLESAERKGSLDSAIKDERPNDIAALLEELPEVTRIILNGTKAAQSFRRYCKEISTFCVQVPSTSPMRGKNVKTYGEKRVVWQSALAPLLTETRH